MNEHHEPTGFSARRDRESQQVGDFMSSSGGSMALGIIALLIVLGFIFAVLS